MHRKTNSVRKAAMFDFTCQVVTPGRAFLRRLIGLTCHVSKPTHYIKMISEERADIKG